METQVKVNGGIEIVVTQVDKSFKTRVKELAKQAHNLTGVVTVYRLKQLYPGFKASNDIHWLNLADKLNALLIVPEPETVQELCEMYNLTCNVKSDNLGTEYLLYSGNAFFGVISFSSIWQRYTYAFRTNSSNTKRCNNIFQAYTALKNQFDSWNTKTCYGLFPA